MQIFYQNSADKLNWNLFCSRYKYCIQNSQDLGVSKSTVKSTTIVTGFAIQVIYRMTIRISIRGSEYKQFVYNSPVMAVCAGSADAAKVGGVQLLSFTVFAIF